MISHAPMPSAGGKPPQRRLAQNPSTANALRNNTTGANVIINPPLQPATARPSPSKLASPFTSTSPLTPIQPAQSNSTNTSKLGAVSFKPPPDTHKPTDSIQKKQPFMSRFKTVAQKPPASSDGTTTTTPTTTYPGKENSHPVPFPATPGLNVSIESYYQNQKPTGKRLLEAPVIKDSRPAKKQRIDDGPLPAHDSFPPIVDDGLKPGHSYAMLIGMAILRAPARKLTLAQIYKWISDTYSFYSPQDAGWQNSIRHNLSLNKAFVKQERPKDDPGKGNYWAIEPGMEHLFMKDKGSRKPPPSSDSLQVLSGTVMEPSLPPMPKNFHEPALPPQLPPMPHGIMDPSTTPSVAAGHSSKQQELSSDATIIASELGTPEKKSSSSHEKSSSLTLGPEQTDATVLDSCLYSPIPAAALHSSPPIARHIEASSGTPPPVPRAPLGSSVNRTRKRKSASVDDSGYISSLESSALRSNQNSRHLPSDGVDRSRIKRGRAEEEIARLRASSYDSPTKNRSRSGYHPTSSSPLRQNEGTSGHMLPPPLTPAVKLKAPLKPPPSVSPGTNLRMHRDKVRHMLASPLRRMASADDVPGWGSPGPFDESLYNFTDEVGFSVDPSGLGSAFEIFQDDSLPNLFPTVSNGSPIKAPSSGRRPRMDRSQSVSILSEVTNSAPRRGITSGPFLKVPAQSPSVNFDTPSKFFDGLPSSPSKFFNMQSPSKMPSTGLAGPLDAGLGDENTCFPLDDFCTPEFIQDVDEFGGLDILQGFEKIGSHTPLFNVPAAPLMPYSQPAQQANPRQQPQQSQQQQSRTKGGPKATLGRSYTTTF